MRNILYKFGDFTNLSGHDSDVCVKYQQEKFEYDANEVEDGHDHHHDDETMSDLENKGKMIRNEKG